MAKKKESQSAINKRKAQQIRASIESTSDKLDSASSTFSKQQDKIISTIGKHIKVEDDTIRRIIKELNDLDKTSEDYKERKESLETSKKESESKISLYDSLQKEMETSSKLTDSLFKTINKSGVDKVGSVLAEQIVELNKAVKLLERETGRKQNIDLEGVNDEFSEVLTERQATELNKKLSRLNKSLDFSKRSGLTASAVNMGLTGLGSMFGVGIVGKIASDLFEVPDKLDSLLRREQDSEKIDKKTQEFNEKLRQRINESENLTPDQKSRMQSRMARENEREDDIMDEQTEAYRDESLYLQREALNKNKENASMFSSFFGSLLAFLTGRKFLDKIGAAAAAGALGKALPSRGGKSGKGGKNNFGRLALAGSVIGGALSLKGITSGREFDATPLGMGDSPSDYSYVLNNIMYGKNDGAFNKTKEKMAFKALRNASSQTGVPLDKLLNLHKKSGDEDNLFNLSPDTVSYIVQNYGSKYNLTGSGGINEMALIAALSIKLGRKNTPTLLRNSPRRNYLNDYVDTSSTKANTGKIPPVVMPQQNKQQTSEVSVKGGKQSIDDIDMIPEDKSLLIQVSGGFDG